MSRNYALNTELAKEAGVSNRIDATGKYIGKFTRAEAVHSKEQTEGVEFTFQSTDKRTADFLTCWTFNVEGKELYGLKMVNALMTCMKVKEIKPQQGTVERYDGKVAQVELFQDLMNKPIGVLLQKEEYQKNDGTIGTKFNIVGCFDAVTEMTAKEILERAIKAEQLGGMVALLKDRPMSNKKTTTQNARTASNSGSGNHAFADFEDDIPF